jgi:hypothetical protein
MCGKFKVQDPKFKPTPKFQEMKYARPTLPRVSFGIDSIGSFV